MDYDVEVRGLSAPTSPSPLAPCRLAVSIRNNGIHDAIASGYARVYSAGLLIFETELYSDTIGPGETRDATSTEYWTPPAEGSYMICGYLSCPLDSVEPNNNLNPTTIIVSGTTPVPPTPVPLHAAQHEEGGKDEVSVEGLRGRTADQQTPINHASQHQAAGADQLNVAGLSGVLGEAQVPTNHGNERHNTDFASMAELTNHANATVVHSAATNLASRDLSGTRTGLVPKAQLCAGTVDPAPDQSLDLFAVRNDGFWGPTEPKRHHTAHEPGGADEISFPTSALPDNIICAWSTMDGPIPAGWIQAFVVPGLTPPHTWIKYNPNP
jgi:hypothetical protein